MKFVITNDFMFWCSTVVISGKVQELRQNNREELYWVDAEKNHLRVEGTAGPHGSDPHARALEGALVWGVSRGGAGVAPHGLAQSVIGYQRVGPRST